ncbi:Na/Pi cotransporter family protein [Clostridium vitabionis]|uniref:Na/Pi cotransporter family protein n=1 Tax=Clostridium vitabionis TaxID=2784388 RepID=UPI00188BA126|nr:Na/Pi cotransporter family protein [Clostridium vitabionis]
MGIENILSLIGGLALFLYGMHVLGDGLTRLSGGRMESILSRLTSNKYMGILLGLGVTAVIQSSSATTVMVVGFVNSGLMKLQQAVGVIMGANIGTTVTSWILSLAGISGSNVFLSLLKPQSFSPVLAMIGVILIMTAKSDKKQTVGTILIGFAVLMFGMEAMSDSVAPLEDVPAFTRLFVAFSNPLLGMLVGVGLTAIIQSSSASVGILQALCMTGAVPYAAAIPIIMGQNIGTCVTALLSSIGAKINAKRAAFIHLYFNVIGTLLFMAVFYLINLVHPFSFLNTAAGPAGIAIVHSTFNICATLVLLPFSDLLVKLATLSVRDHEAGKSAEKGRPEELGDLDPRFLEQPAFALRQSASATERMATLARQTYSQAFAVVRSYSEDEVNQVYTLESRVDSYEDELTAYLTKIMTHDLPRRDSLKASELQHCIGDFERITDHALNVAVAAQKMHRKGQAFSQDAEGDLGILDGAIREILSLTAASFIADDTEQASRVEPLAEVIDLLSEKINDRHMQRLAEGRCTVEMGFVLQDITSDMKRIADHCSNIAITVMQMKNGSIGQHGYKEFADREGSAYHTLFLGYQAQFALPESAHKDA